MIKWLILFPMNVLVSVICYLTNPIAVLFADERGELHGIGRYWQTWDDSVDVEWFVKETVPGFLRYDFDKHYKSSREHTKALDRYNRDKGCVVCINPHFTARERLQRYVCRVLWLTRNCGYGFSFYLFGANHVGLCLKGLEGENYTLLYGSDLIGSPWQLNANIWRFRIMAGWKLDKSSTCMTRSMIAGRIIIR